jgi:hypothetical protein
MQKGLLRAQESELGSRLDIEKFIKSKSDEIKSQFDNGLHSQFEFEISNNSLAYLHGSIQARTVVERPRKRCFVEVPRRLLRIPKAAMTIALLITARMKRKRLLAARKQCVVARLLPHRPHEAEEEVALPKRFEVEALPRAPEERNKCDNHSLKRSIFLFSYEHRYLFSSKMTTKTLKKSVSQRMSIWMMVQDHRLTISIHPKCCDAH